MLFDAARFDPANIPALVQHMLSGHTLGPDLGYSPQSQEAMYALAHMLYSQRKFDEAMRLFGMLVMCDHLDRRYHMGLGACLQLQGNHAKAIRSYGAASVLDLTDPIPFLHAAECHLALGRRKPARVALDYALVQARAHERHARHVARLEAMVALLESGGSPASNAQPTHEGG
jgi:type III secretion system low calcium response chaperone LcrH/SycD